MIVKITTGPRIATVLAIVAIVVAALVIYRPILTLSPSEGLHPWASDTLGHLLKTQFMAEELRSGNLYPQLFPDWYGGVQLLRYFPPLPYYLLAGLFLLSGNIVFAGGAFVFGAALLGGLSFLLYRRWISLLPATLAGVLFLALPDNLRVALAEGNLPRVLATAWLPLAFYALLAILIEGPTRMRFVLLAAFTALIVLSHAMMGAIFVSCFVLVIIVYWFTSRAKSRAVGTALAGVFSGLLLSGWWLLPSLTGGITELNSEAAGEALVSLPLVHSLDPLARYESKEMFYLGLSLVGGLVLALVGWKRLSPLCRSLLIVGVPLLLLSSTAINPVYRTVPFNELMWPIRFMSFAGFILLLGLMVWVSQLLKGSWKAKLLAGSLVVALALDTLPSLPLIHVRPAWDELTTVAERIRELPGWRVATADFSRLGSRASYLFSAAGEREQVYGWAYQGSQIAPLLSSINFAMERGHSAYAVDRLEETGADYVVRLKGITIDPSFDDLLRDRGYTVAEETQSLILYYRPGGPRAYVPQYRALGIGSGARSLALLFPELLVGKSDRIDDYDPKVLNAFPTLVLSGFSWSDKSRAEKLVREYASQGRRVIVDLTGVPEEVLSKRPKFLGIYGEPLSLYSAPTLSQAGQQITLSPFDPKYSPWNTLTPQGLDASTVTFGHLEQEGTAIGYRGVDGGRVWFLGLNLPFHSMLTKDPAGIALLEGLLGLEAGALSQRQEVPLKQYRAGSDGYTFDYTMAEGNLLAVPIARHDGTTLSIDGRTTELLPLGSVTHFWAPAGTHTVRIGFQPTPIYKFGLAATGLALLLMGAVLIHMGRRRVLVPGEVAAMPHGDPAGAPE